MDRLALAFTDSSKQTKFKMIGLYSASSLKWPNGVVQMNDSTNSTSITAADLFATCNIAGYFDFRLGSHSYTITAAAVDVVGFRSFQIGQDNS